MPRVITLGDLPFAGSSHEMEGYLNGDAPVTLIFFDGAPGSGPKLHRHPYAEIFIVQEGTATFTVDGETFQVHGGQIAMAPAGVPHKFVNSGSEATRHVDIHISPRMITTWLEE